MIIITIAILAMLGMLGLLTVSLAFGRLIEYLLIDIFTKGLRRRYKMSKEDAEQLFKDWGKPRFYLYDSTGKVIKENEKS